VKRALPGARIGGPASTGPSNTKAAAFLRQFLEHCSTRNVPLDFITYHAKGRPSVVDGHVRMGISKNADDVDKGFRIVREFPKFQNLPIVLSESDPEGCAACSGAGLSAECVSQRSAVCVLHGRDDEEYF
jgi:xylan 1,4-beta-xylosidase